MPAGSSQIRSHLAVGASAIAVAGGLWGLLAWPGASPVAAVAMLVGLSALLHRFTWGRAASEREERPRGRSRP